MGLAQDRAALLRAADLVDEAAGLLSQAGGKLDEAERTASSVIEGYDNADLIEASGAIVEVNLTVSDAVVSAVAAVTKIRDYVARLS